MVSAGTRTLISSQHEEEIPQGAEDKGIVIEVCLVQLVSTPATILESISSL